MSLSETLLEFLTSGRFDGAVFREVVLFAAFGVVVFLGILSGRFKFFYLNKLVNDKIKLVVYLTGSKIGIYIHIIFRRGVK